jgi:hypothetical protein
MPGSNRWVHTPNFPSRTELFDETSSRQLAYVVRDLLGRCYWRADGAHGSCLNLNEAQQSAEAAPEKLAGSEVRGGPSTTIERQPDGPS